MSYAELQVTTHFSFLRGASSAQELFETAKALGIEALGVVDRNSLAGIVRALEASRATGLRLVVGCRLDLADGMSVLVYPTDRAAYSRLTRLITLGKSRGGKNNCILHWDDVVAYNDGMIGILVPDLPDDTCAIQLRKMAELFGDRAYVSLCLRRRQNDQLRDDLVPIEPATMKDRQIIEWDKDDVEALKFMKVDILALGMLTCMAKAFDLIREHKDRDLDLSDIEQEDPATYAMIRKADTLGTFQIESRAQMAMLPRLKPRTFYDLVVQVAIVRPGPIQGDMVHPYLRRREGKEPVEYPTPELEAVLGKTLGVPLFQESAMRVAMVCAGFTGGEADQLRKSMATFKFTGGVSRFKDKLVSGMVRNGYTPEFAEKTFSQLEGFGSYGFPESHAASFALIAYASSYIKCHYPEAFCAALINSQPMGFYAPAQIVGDARTHGVEVRPVCINRSRWDCTLERIGNAGGHAVRLGFRQVKGLAVADAARIVAARMDNPFASVDDMWRRSSVPSEALVQLANADTFLPSLKLERRDALWAIKALRDEPLPLFQAAAEREMAAIAEQQEPEVALRQMTDGHNVIEDYSHTGLTLRQHPVAFLRKDLSVRNIITCAEAMSSRDGRWVYTAGLVLVRQKPGSAKGVMFITIDDETGPANLVVWPTLFEKRRRVVLGSSMMAINGRIQREGEVVHLVAQQLFDLSGDLVGLADRDEEFRLPAGRGDEFARGGGSDPRDKPKPVIAARDMFVPDRHIDTLKVKSRNFH
ncbi:PHP domain-containing protein [Rhizobium leguminosarum]|uniref:helix-hairpin-helix domain-containing protein n=1 Tax=Rhizobium leguminosarum TaxID=384 RepID=UPI001C95790C|nr:PHP domain-containing protein [Rhizobium leguminosarum]MBY5543619.1 PHP domain-containing protein [Rhizobium leguminosarum]